MTALGVLVLCGVGLFLLDVGWLRLVVDLAGATVGLALPLVASKLFDHGGIWGAALFCVPFGIATGEWLFGYGGNPYSGTGWWVGAQVVCGVGSLLSVFVLVLGTYLESSSAIDVRAGVRDVLLGLVALVFAAVTFYALGVFWFAPDAPV